MSVTAAQGFRAGSASAGLRSSGRPDVAVLVNDGPLEVAAAVFTRNRCRAHPVLWSEHCVGSGTARAVAVNAGNANCYTGPEGFAVTRHTAQRVAELLSVPGAHPLGPADELDVLVCSTGVIGVPMSGSAVVRGVAEALASVSHAPEAGLAAAEAIMTTDTRPKQALVSRASGSGATGPEAAGWCVGGMAKGAGMLAPQLATMLAFLTTDAVLTAAEADAALRAAVRQTFERVDSDGCLSTNDTVILLASGASGSRPAPEAFTLALTEACADLAGQLVADAEGADHEVAVVVRGAATEADAVEVGRAVARSALVKTALFGGDPNWGRILAAVGTTAAAFDPAVIDISVNGVAVCRGGAPGEPRDAIDLGPRHVQIEITLHAGEVEATVWTNDLTYAYVHENSAYTT